VENHVVSQPRPRRLLVGAATVALAAASFAPSALPAPAPVHRAVEHAVVAARTSAVDGTYELYRHTAPSKPVRWLACRSIEYRINTTDEPKGMTKVVQHAFRLIGKQTGVTFRYGGTTKHRFSSTSHSRTTPTIYIAFTKKASAYGQTFAWPGEIGVGGPSAAWYATGTGKTFEAATFGRVLLSTRFHGAKTGPGATWQSLIVHEVGHALNLAHRSAKTDDMYPSLTKQSPGRFSPREVKALKQVLQRSGCDYKAFSRL
jgi:hypothetical protein